jgi:cyclase
MLRPRIIPCLLVHKGGLVKTTRFGEPRYVGDPLNAVKLFNEKEADELMVLDIDATRTGTLPDLTRIARLAVECRMPLCYGGGVQSSEQASRIIGLGVEKVALSAAAIARPTLVREIAREIGSQSVVVVLDVRLQQGAYTVWTHNGTRDTGLLATHVAERAEAMGAGEIVVNSIDRDGTMAGYDLALARQMRAATSLPLTVLGGAASLADLGALFSACGVVGAAAGSLFVFKGAHRAVLLNYPSAAQRDELGLRTVAAR